MDTESSSDLRSTEPPGDFNMPAPVGLGLEVTVREPHTPIHRGQGIPSVHVVGDSVSIHYGPHLDSLLEGNARYSRKEASAGGFDVSSDANGRDSSELLRHLADCLNQGRKWDVLVMNAGLHDIRRRNGVLQTSFIMYYDNLREISSIAHRIARRTVWVQTTPVDEKIHNSLKTEYQRYQEDVKRVNTIAAQVMLDASIAVFDLSPLERLEVLENIRQDHVHYSRTFRMLQAAALFGYVQSVLHQDVNQSDAARFAR
jgi:hypothetical protein